MPWMFVPLILLEVGMGARTVLVGSLHWEFIFLWYKQLNVFLTADWLAQWLSTSRVPCGEVAGSKTLAKMLQHN